MLPLDQVLLTPFRTRNVPPPMSFAKISTRAIPKYIAFGPQEESDHIAILLSNNMVEFWGNVASTTSEIRQESNIK